MGVRSYTGLGGAGAILLASLAGPSTAYAQASPQEEIQRQTTRIISTQISQLIATQISRGDGTAEGALEAWASFAYSDISDDNFDSNVFTGIAAAQYGFNEFVTAGFTVSGSGSNTDITGAADASATTVSFGPYAAVTFFNSGDTRIFGTGGLQYSRTMSDGSEASNAIAFDVNMNVSQSFGDFQIRPALGVRRSTGLGDNDGGSSTTFVAKLTADYEFGAITPSLDVEYNRDLSDVEGRDVGLNSVFISPALTYKADIWEVTGAYTTEVARDEGPEIHTGTITGKVRF